MQVAQIAAAGNAVEKALLARVTEKNLDASYIVLLRLFKARCRMRTRSARCICVCCIVSAARLARISQAPQSPHSRLPEPFDGSVVVRRPVRCCAVSCICLFVVCLFATGLCKTQRPWRGLRRTRVVARQWPICGLLRRSALCVHWCAATNPAEPLPHKRTVCMRRAPRRGEYRAVSESSPRTSRHADRPGGM